MESHERHAHQILTEIESGQRHSQRSLATGAGIALGLTNLLMRRFVRRGWVRVVRIRPNRVKYFLTPNGLAERARMSRLFLQESVKFYANARERVGTTLRALSDDWPAVVPEKRIAFYGVGEVAEIAYVSLQETDLHLSVVITEGQCRRFFNVPVVSGTEIAAGQVDVPVFDRLVVTTFENQETIRARLTALRIPPERVVWL